MSEFAKENDRYEGRQVPMDCDAERYLLGGILRDPNVIAPVIETVNEDEFFYLERHQVIWHAMKVLYGQGTPIDMLTLPAELEKEGNLSKAGGREYIFEMMESVASSANVDWNLQHLRNKYVLRKLIKMSSETIKKAMDASNSPDEVLQAAERDVFAIAEKQVKNSLKPIENFVTPLLDRLNNRKDGITGVPTGITELDQLTNGLQNSDLIILAARPGVGKTSFALTIAANAAIDYHKNVAFFSLEMDGVQLAQRLLCSRAQIDQSKLRNNKLSNEEMRKLITMVAPINQAPLFVDDNADLGIMELMSKARDLKRKGNLDMLIIDYLQLMKTGGEENRAVAIGAISRGLKILAKDCKFPSSRSHSSAVKSKRRAAKGPSSVTSANQALSNKTPTWCGSWNASSCAPTRTKTSTRQNSLSPSTVTVRSGTSSSRLSPNTPRSTTPRTKKAKPMQLTANTATTTTSKRAAIPSEITSNVYSA